MSSTTIKAGETKKIMGTNAVKRMIKEDGVNRLYMEGRGADFSVSKRREFAEDSFTFRDTSSFALILGKSGSAKSLQHGDAVYIKNRSKTDTLTIEWAKQAFIFENFTTGRRASDNRETELQTVELENVDLEDRNRIEVDLTEVGRTNIGILFDATDSTDLEVYASTDAENWVRAETYQDVASTVEGFDNGFRYIALENVPSGEGTINKMAITGGR